MRVIVVGLGIQGRKRFAVAGDDVVATVDPAQPAATCRALTDVPVGSYDAALVSVPDSAKIELLTYLLEHRKHVLVEKPLVAHDDALLERLGDLARLGRVACYTAYNHRFEPHFVRMKALLDSGELGEIYRCRMFYGNGTARDVRNSPWRDRGAGVLADLGSHLLDTVLYWFGPRNEPFRVFSCSRFENAAFDHVVVGAEGHPTLELEMTLLSHRNHFTCDILAEHGSAHIESLCKWGPSVFTRRRRKLPSGRPEEEAITVVQPDPTWELEYAYFRGLCATGGGNIENDLAINRWLGHLAAEALGDGVGMSVRIGFAGMTHLGVISALAAAERGYAVVGFDSDQAVTSALQRAIPPVEEPGLPALLEKHAARMSFSDRVEALSTCDVVYISRDTPTNDEGASDVSTICALIDLVVPALRVDAILVVLSQVSPGFTRSVHWPPAQRFYQVETLVFGRAVTRALEPERIILGCADPSIELPTAIAQYLNAFGAPILRMRYESAELAKISVNMYLVASVSVANTLAELCEHIGADWREIVPALKLDQRIGQHAYLNPGLGVGGGNLERDLTAVCQLADAHGTDAGSVRAWMSNSRHRRDWALAMVHDRVIARVSEPTLGVLGLAYKEDTASTRNSPSLALLAALHPFPIRVYDPVVAPRKEFHPRLLAADSAIDACTDADALVIMTPWPEFRALRPAEIAARLRGRTVIDPHGMLDSRACRKAGLNQLVLGAPNPANLC